MKNYKVSKRKNSYTFKTVMAKAKYILKFIYYFLPFLLFFVIIGQIQNLIAKSTNKPIPTFNKNLEAAKILHLRNKQFIFSQKGYDIYLVGTSRTMSDYNPIIMQNFFNSSNPLRQNITVYNLGNLANNFNNVIAFLDNNTASKVFIFEFAIHCLVESTHPSETAIKQTIFDRYRKRIKIFELYVSGNIHKYLNMTNMLFIKPDIIKIFISWFKDRNIIVDDIYYYLLKNQGFGQVAGKNGQVFYRKNYENKQVAVNSRSDLLISNINNFTLKLKNKSLDPSNLDNLHKIIKKIKKNSGQIVFVRPPIDKSLYDLENRLQKKSIEKVQSSLHENSIKFIDLNPHSYYSTDQSHIDWFDTDSLSIELAQKLLTVINWNEINR